MAGTTKQIFDQLQSTAPTSGVYSKSSQAAHASASNVDRTAGPGTASEWSQLKALGANTIAWLNTQGINDAYFQTMLHGTGSNASIEFFQHVKDFVAAADQSEKEFSPRMMVCDAYKSAKTRLQDQTAPTGVAIYNKMFNIHNSTVQGSYQTINTYISTEWQAFTSLKNALTNHPIPAVVPPATAPVVHVDVTNACTAWKADLDHLTSLIHTAIQNGVAALSSDKSTMDEYLKYISNANLAKVLPDWYADANKKTIIDSMTSTQMQNLIRK